jgi:hypothetical protein
MLTPDCVNFINKLVNTTTGKSYDASTEFLADLMTIANFKESGMSRESGIFYHSALGEAGGVQSGSLAAGDAAIYIGGTYTPMKSTSPYNIRNEASTIVAELVHAVAATTDLGGARALAKMGVIPVGANGQPLPFPQAPVSAITPYSLYFHTAVKNACKPNY